MRRYKKSDAEIKTVVSNAMRRFCNTIAAAVFIYAIIERDVPVGMISFAVLIGNLPSDGRVLRIGIGRETSRMLHAFSITMFIGAIFLLFFY